MHVGPRGAVRAGATASPAGARRIRPGSPTIGRPCAPTSTTRPPRRCWTVPVRPWSRPCRTPGNASSLHAAGRAARRRVEESRETIAAALGVTPSEVIFTAGGTEADNLAVKGLWWARAGGRTPHGGGCWPPGSSTTRSSTRSTGWASTRVPRWSGSTSTPRAGSTWTRSAPSWPPTRDGRRWWPSCGPTTRSGPSSRSTEIAAVCAEAGVPLHVDAVQAVGSIPVDAAPAGHAWRSPRTSSVGRWGSARWSPGAGSSSRPLTHGGGQERQVRSGTLDVPALVGFAAAVEHVLGDVAGRSARTAALRDELFARVLEVAPGRHRQRGDRRARRAAPGQRALSRSPGARATRC